MSELQRALSPVRWLTDREFEGLPLGHKLVAWADSQVGDREVGVNRGRRVEEYQAVAGLGSGGGFAWCAAFVYWCCLRAGFAVCGLPALGKCAAVRNWVSLAESRGSLRPSAARGRLFFWLNRNGTGHIGVCLGPSVLGIFRTIEGNTDGESGSREGAGVYKRTRTIWGLRGHAKSGFIDLAKLTEGCDG